MEGLVLTRLSGEGVGGLPREGVAGGAWELGACWWGLGLGLGDYGLGRATASMLPRERSLCLEALGWGGGGVLGDGGFKNFSYF